jgi:hypothetical protein
VFFRYSRRQDKISTSSLNIKQSYRAISENYHKSKVSFKVRMLT